MLETFIHSKPTSKDIAAYVQCRCGHKLIKLTGNQSGREVICCETCNMYQDTSDWFIAWKKRRQDQVNA